MKAGREIAWTWIGLGIVAISMVFFFVSLPAARSAFESAEKIAFVAAVVFLVWGNVVYHLARLGYLYRHRAFSKSLVRNTCAGQWSSNRPLGILIPSYREEQGVLLQTILSAALMRCRHRHIVVLLDDPPNVGGPDLISLQATRALVKQIDEEFRRCAERLQAQYDAFKGRQGHDGFDVPYEAEQLARIYENHAQWVESWADRIIATTPLTNKHTSKWFVEHVLSDFTTENHLLAQCARSAVLTNEAIHQAYQSAIDRVSPKIESFERKLFVNLSHRPSKAMNLNSYIGLIGGHYREAARSDGLHLLSCANHEATIVVPDFEFVLTLDADSAVLPNYASILLPIMEQDSRIAVVQTPYSAFTGAPGALERIAGATTDIQYLIHQGFTQFDATYWVGANAILRVSALREIAATAQERGYSIRIFIQDRTVIEDTDSTVDLIRTGWRVHNHPERLAYSATPPDFGSLIIQRRRWSNGGLIILPDLLHHLWSKGQFVRCLPESLMRTHYLCSPAVAGLSMLFLLLYRIDDSLANFWLPMTAASYYWLYAKDLHFAGYRVSDFLRVYALNLLLLPVNLAGVFRSLQQAVTGRKSLFGRTPKIGTRTSTPFFYIAFHLALLGYLVVICSLDLSDGHYSHAVFGGLTFVLFFYGFSQFIGWREAAADTGAYLEVVGHRIHAQLASFRTSRVAAELGLQRAVNLYARLFDRR
jgi:cellulose synthase/poly-beta-1,6-N-acetylglucosamine synthase-like glycosyltransferase